MIKSIVFISHKLNEVMEISDRISVMRQGNYIGTVDKEKTNTAELARMMIGREVLMSINKNKSDIGDVLLKVDDLWTSGEKEISKIRGVSFDLRAGEILGIAGYRRKRSKRADRGNHRATQGGKGQGLA